MRKEGKEGRREETRCQRQARKDVTGLMRREDGEGMAGRACVSAGSTAPITLVSPGMLEAPGSGGKAGTGQRGRRAGKMEMT